MVFLNDNGLTIERLSDHIFRIRLAYSATKQRRGIDSIELGIPTLHQGSFHHTGRRSVQILFQIAL